MSDRIANLGVAISACISVLSTGLILTGYSPISIDVECWAGFRIGETMIEFIVSLDY